MAEFKILIGENTQEATSSSSHPRLNSFCLQPRLPCAQRRAQEPEGRKPWEENQGERQIPEKPQPREGWQHTTMDVRSAWGCRPLSKVLAQRKRGKKKKREKSSNGPRRGRRLAGVFSRRSWPGGAGEQEPCAKLPALRRLHPLPEQHKTQHHERGEIFPGTSAAYPTGFTSQPVQPATKKK